METNEEIKKLIEDVVTITLVKLGKDGFPFCMIEAVKVKQLEERLTVLNNIITGGDKPNDGIVYQFSLIRQDVIRFGNGIWAMASVGLGLIIVAIWQIIAK